MPGRRYLWMITMSFLALTSCAAQARLRTAQATPLVTSDSTPTTRPLPAGAPGPTASPSIPARLGQPAHLYTLDMFSADQGIAVDLQGRLLRTLDGGQHWTVAAPTGVQRVGPFAAVPNAPGQPVWTVATVSWSANGETPGTALLTTADDGWSFEERALPRLLAQGSVPSPTFIDAQHGWLLVGLGAAASSEAVSIYRTVDGGRTWQPQRIDAPIDVGGDRQRQPGAIGPPHFFDRQDGVLPAYWGRGVVLVTHDGGASWVSTAPLPASAHPPLWAFLDSRHWWASDGATLSVTTDAGQHWRQITPNGALTGLDQLQFVTPDLGWAVLAAETGRPATVLQTTDGGQSWVDLQPEVLGE